MVSLSSGAFADRMYSLVERLYPICRSITGEGFRETQRILQEYVPSLALRGVPSGSQAFDWTVPKEWNISDAYVRGPSGDKVIDFRDSNLHVVNYSAPVHERLSLEELKKRLHSLPESPSLIPYRTSYYKRDWGFCLAHEDLTKLAEGTYEVFIDSTLEDGELNYGEWVHQGETDEEVLFTAHACHPSLCNDNLSGVVVAAFLAHLLARTQTRYTYRVLFLPGGIGSVVWMSRNQDILPRIRHGLVLSCIGDAAPFTYKKTRRGDATIDTVVQHVLKAAGAEHQVIDFSPYGYDERNFCSPRHNLPVGSLTRSTHSEFSGYHSSGDNLDLVSGSRLEEALFACLSVVSVLEGDCRYLNLIPDAEPQLGKRGLYGMMGGLQKRAAMEMALLWVMNLSDGRHGLLEIAERSGYSFDLIREAAELLVTHEILRRAAPGETL